MPFLLFVGVLFLLWLSVFFRTIFFHPFKAFFYAFSDLKDFFVYKKWRFLSTGKIIAYTALFGQGKTLSVVHYILGLYRRYNDKLVFDVFRKKWVIQKVHIISNVTLNVPYEEFTGLQQIVDAASFWEQYDEEHDTLTQILVLGDEFSVQMNSRQFKSNIDPLFLNTLLTCRHHHITLVYDAQRFNQVDALLRQVTSYVVSCHKIWRVVVSEKYDAWKLENASSPSSVRPMRRFGWFVRNSDFNAYDTLATVGNLSHSCSSGDMVSEDEILSRQANSGNLNVSIKVKKRKLA